MTGPQGVVYLRDIGYVTDGFKDTTTISRLDGVQAVTLTVSKRAGENIIAVADEVRRVAKLHEKRMLPGMKIHVTMDQSEDIRDMVAELENSILSGLILVLIIIFIFLGFYNAIFVALAIPVSMLITFIILYATETTLNMVVLFSLMLALGMLVDNGIVVIENIYRHIQMGKTPINAAKTGAAEVAWPIIASTATTLAAFSPMFFWPGIWGEFMVFMPLTVSLALGASLFVGLVVNPALAATFMLSRDTKTTPEEQRKLELEAPSGHAILRVYGAVLEVALNWRGPVIVLALTTLIVIGNIFINFAHIEFVPTTEPRSAYIDVDGPEGANLESTDALIRKIEDRVKEQQEHLDFIIANVGSKGVSAFGGMGGAGGQTAHLGRVTLDFPKLQDAKIKPSVLIKSLRDRFDDITGARITMDQQQEGPTDAPPINVELSGEDYNILAELALKIEKILETVPDVIDIQNDYDKGKPEVRVVVDREQAILLGLNTRLIGNIIQAAISGRKAGEYHEGDEEYDVMVRFPKEFRQNLSNLQHMTLINLRGQPVPFSAIAKLEHGAGLGSIRRINRKHAVSVFSEVQNRSGAEVLKDAQAALKDFVLPPGYTMSFTGENEDQQEASDFLSRAFVIALFLIALVLITQFNSLTQPLIIMTSVILSLAGVFLGLLLCNMPFSIIMSGIGCISLAGVVVNNAIVLIDFINQLRHHGLTTHEAILHAGKTRFRPVMLTAVTTILGLIPMAIGVSFDFRNATWIIGGDSSQWWGPMAIVVIFGLAFATLLTLIVVPVLYSLTDTWHRLLFKNGETSVQEGT
jgi:multidrug efflux pump subunit AcrB